jgi:hypothetical protein
MRWSIPQKPVRTPRLVAAPVEAAKEPESETDAPVAVKAVKPASKKKQGVTP